MFGAMFAYVFVRSFQQRNVIHDNYKWILPVSMCMATIDVFIIAYIAHKGFRLEIVIANGSGGGFGCLLAMYLHKRWVKK